MADEIFKPDRNEGLIEHHIFGVELVERVDVWNCNVQSHHGRYPYRKSFKFI
jgi:hypothetical protein